MLGSCTFPACGGDRIAWLRNCIFFAAIPVAVNRSFTIPP